MLKPQQLKHMTSAMDVTDMAGKHVTERVKRNFLVERAEGIRECLNPHPAGQKEENVPKLNGREVLGIQHKYRETVLFFPSEVCIWLFNQ